jgi:hypothetical protein
LETRGKQIKPQEDFTMELGLNMEIKLADYDETNAKSHDIDHRDDIGFFSNLINDKTFNAY